MQRVILRAKPEESIPLRRGEVVVADELASHATTGEGVFPLGAKQHKARLAATFTPVEHTCPTI